MLRRSICSVDFPVNLNNMCICILCMCMCRIYTQIYIYIAIYIQYTHTCTYICLYIAYAYRQWSGIQLFTYCGCNHWCAGVLIMKWFDRFRHINLHPCAGLQGLWGSSEVNMQSLRASTSGCRQSRLEHGTEQNSGRKRLKHPDPRG